MRLRVHHILLVSSLYDSFTLAEDGQVNDAILGQFLDLNLSSNPDLTRVSTGVEALELLEREPRFDMVITSLRVGEMDATELARRLRGAGSRVPVILLAYSNRELTDFRASHDLGLLDRVFLWQGDARILLAIVKYVEDRLNVAHDTGEMGVPVIVVVEDNVRFYSSFLPVIYSELMDHTQRLMSEGVNLSQKVMRQRSRPKILLAETYEEAWRHFSSYREHVLGLISDIEFPWRDGPFNRAGVELAARVRQARSDLPVMLQSSFPENEELARSVGASFLLKGSPMLLHQLRDFMVANFGFGEFEFRAPDGGVLGRAADLSTLVQMLHSVPSSSIAYHGERNHFSNWFKARGEFALAHTLRPRQVSDYATLQDLRQDLIDSIRDYRRERDRVAVADFDRRRQAAVSNITRIGGGSLGGKARGLAFVNRLLSEYRVQQEFEEIEISVPPSVVLGTDIFDQFLEQNELRGFAIRSTSDAETVARFARTPLPEAAQADLAAFLELVRYPLAVRSSGLLEDSPSQPFAGVYQTWMLPNNHADPAVRLRQLCDAVRRVYASTFSEQAKAFLRMTPFRLEEEKMAVIIQQIVGRPHADRFYPDFAGVARSHNFYPTPPLRAEDGIVAVALGLGRTVVEGESCLRFCPRWPRQLPAHSSADDLLRNSQREFYALDLEADGVAELRRHPLKVAEADGTLAALGSTYSPDNDVIYDGITRPGVRLVSFAAVLKHGLFPLARLLDVLLEIGSAGTSTPVEIEFAVNLTGGEGRRPEFGFLQMRPMALSSELEELEIGHVLTSRLLCRSGAVLGNGRVEGVRDLVVVDPERLERSQSHEIAREVAAFNAKLQAEGRPYVLIGAGRWGSADPNLGIPVAWAQIAGARVIVETGFRDMQVTPSQGSHFFQNLTSCNIGYFTVNAERDEGFVDWAWLAARPAVDETRWVRHLRLQAALTVVMSGISGEGVILKPEEA